ncbi:hypothetical protein HDV02_006265 [Globomyces sp. JEL0801]|nr:hypothetical protein HDV02_006265 [Globomyces sp. JEL0801]
MLKLMFVFHYTLAQLFNQSDLDGNSFCINLLNRQFNNASIQCLDLIIDTNSVTKMKPSKFIPLISQNLPAVCNQKCMNSISNTINSISSSNCSTLLVNQFPPISTLDAINAVKILQAVSCVPIASDNTQFCLTKQLISLPKSVDLDASNSYSLLSDYAVVCILSLFVLVFFSTSSPLTT